MNRHHGRKLANMRRMAFGLLLVFGLSLTSSPAAGGDGTARAQGDEDSYTDPAFGWSISWDPELWQMGGSIPTPTNDDGVAGNEIILAGLKAELGAVLVGSLTTVDGDLADCLNAVMDQVDQLYGVSDVRKTELKLAKTTKGAKRKLSSVLIGGEGGLDALLYVECRPLVEDEAVLGIGWIIPNPENYESALPDFEELTAGLDLKDAHPAGEDARVTKETFTDPIRGWSIDYDPAVWELDGPMEQFADDEDGKRVQTGSGAGLWGKPFDSRGNVYIFGDNANGDDTAACLDALRQSQLEGWPEDDVREAEVDPPATLEDAEWELYELTSSSVSGLYISCAPLVDGESALTITWSLGDAESYEQALPAFEKLLAGLDLSKAHPAGEGGGGGAEKETFTDPIFGWSIAWDPEAWEASGPTESIGEDDKPGTEMDFLGRDYEAMGYVRIASVATVSLDPASCVDIFKPKTSAELTGDGGVVENRQEPDVELPAAPDDAVGRLFTYNAGSPPDQMTYLECRTLVEGEAMLLIEWYLPEFTRYEQALPAFEELIEGLDLSKAHPA